MLIDNNFNHEEQHFDLSKGEHKNPEYLKLNPKATVPFIQDGSFSTGESSTILRYLAKQYKCLEIYPEDIQKRAKIDERMDFCDS